MDLVVRNGRDSTIVSPICDKGWYGPRGGRTRRNGIATRFKKKVPRAKRRRNFPVSSLKITADTVDQKKALRPNAARGNAVAVPR